MDQYSRLSKPGRRSIRAEQSPQVSSLRYFDLVQPSPFYTPQYCKPVSHRERRTPSHRNSVLNTIATPSRNSPRLPKAAFSPERAETCEKQRCSLGRDTPRVNGTGKTRDKQNGRRQEDVNVLINSLLSDNENNGDDVIDDDDVIVIDDDDDEADTSIIDRVSPMASTSSKAAVSTVHPTPTIYTKFQPKSNKVREERRASAAAVVELFNDGSSEDDNDDTMERDDSLIRPTPEVIARKTRRKESVARGPLSGVAPEITRRDRVMKEPLVRVSPLLVTNEEPTAIKRKNERAVGMKTPRLRKKTRTEECMSDDPAIEAKNLVERNKEFVMEDPLAVISPKRSKLRSSRRKPPTDRGETPGIIEKPVMEDPLARLSPPVKKRKLRSSRKETVSTHEAAPEMIKELIREELDEESPDPTVELREEEPVTEKRRTRSSCREPPATTEDGGVAPELTKQTRKEKIHVVTEKRVLRSRNPAPSEENALLAANQIAPEKKTKTVSSSKATGSHQAHKRNLDKELTTTTEVKRTIRRSTRTATIVSTRSSENDRPYMHDSLEGLSSESEWNTTDDDDNDDGGDSSGSEGEEIEVTKGRRTPLKPLNIIISKSRKRSPPTHHGSTTNDGYTNKRLKLSLSSRRKTEKAKKLKKVRTIEKKRVSTPATALRKNGEKTATLLGGRRKLLTPHIPQRKKVTFAKTGTQGSKAKQFEAAKERLHVSALPETIPCRENEFLEICNYVEGKLHDETGGCMYISGVPGTGKTATVREVGRYLKESCEGGDLPEFKFIEINGMRLTEPHRTYVSILKQLTGEDATPDHASLLLDRYFSSADDNKLPTVLLADELDLLWTRKQTVLYNLFDWPTRQHAKLIVLAVANTMDLPEKVMMNKVASRLGLTRLTFQPYTFQQLQEIVTSRMTGLRVFEPDAIQLATRKVAAVSGDARRALDIARRATEIAQLEKGVGLVGIPHIDRAVQEMFSSAKIQAIRHASLHEKMFLKAILAEFRRSGVEEANFKGVHQQLDAIYKTEDMHPANLTELHGICCQLGACRLLLLERGRLSSHTRIRLNISQDDVLFALRT